MMTPQQTAIVQEARSWLGVRYQHQGRSRHGVDCIGLPIEIAKALFGWQFDITNYARQAVDETMLTLCQQHMLPVSRSDLQPGDMLVMRFDNQRHAAIVGDYPAPGELSIIHAYAQMRQVVETRLDSQWLARVIGAFRFPALAKDGA